ncbi:MAG: HAD family phosphatase [Planctomycetes bacterium]|nr:HAD family phosphatase [Planctomycetota bacterium]
MTRYRLLAVDLDGTALGPDQRISDRTGGALRAAKRAGLAVCLCTGRSVAETLPIWQSCGLVGSPDPMICISGALVCEGGTGRTLHIEPMPSSAAVTASELLRGLGLSTILLVDSWRQGFDYYVVEGDDIVAVREKCLAYQQCTVRTMRSLTDMIDLPEMLRLTALGEGGNADSAMTALGKSCDGQLRSQKLFAHGYGVNLIECFAHATDKWAGVRYVAQGLLVGAGDIAAIGDDLNDLPMLTRAGLGVAMGNAVEAVKQAADFTTAGNDQDGVAQFIDQLLDGVFD